MPRQFRKAGAEELAQFFNDKVTVDNKAIGGANVKSFKAGN